MFVLLSMHGREHVERVVELAVRPGDLGALAEECHAPLAMGCPRACPELVEGSRRSCETWECPTVVAAGVQR